MGKYIDQRKYDEPKDTKWKLENIVNKYIDLSKLVLLDFEFYTNKRVLKNNNNFKKQFLKNIKEYRDEIISKLNLLTIR